MQTQKPISSREALALLKSLVSSDNFNIEHRRANHAFPITKQMAKIIVADLVVADFVKYEEDTDSRFSGEYIWNFITQQDEKYYLKFKFIREESWAKFVSFHIAIH